MTYNQNLRLASFDITNMYTKIPTSNLIVIIDTTCRNNHIEENLTQEILKLSGVIINQNFFQFMEKTCLQSEGLAVGAPSSSIFSEFYLQFLEIFKIYILLQSHNILGYLRYVDDILVIYDENRTNIEDLNCFNGLTPNLKFTLEKETECSINFLDITIHGRKHQLLNRCIENLHTQIPLYPVTPVTLQNISWLQYDTYTVRWTTTNCLQIRSIITQQILHNNRYDTSISKAVLRNKKLKHNV